ncbi:EF-hand domain-containing protein [Thermomonas sp. HDW16]|uniref:EF-hand domain-containing protein n=1 Tax=Thermomonas sp. HDW16 TaxID=2714945 RepID=UPI0014097C41|nr:EF-hand domain-containing protein [Thermomonas sp. HDW16]QIL19492.1 EF-hand domain-containing protein [Thermomonas sp. HDW16]
MIHRSFTAKVLLAVLATFPLHVLAQVQVQQAMPAPKPAQATKPLSSKPAVDPAAEAFGAWDKDRNGALSFPEFRAGWVQAQRMAELQARLRHQFMTVDVNDNKAIDPAEYGSLLLIKNAGKSAPQMSVFDANRDGKLEFNEYVKLVGTLAPKDSGKGAAK